MMGMGLRSRKPRFGFSLAAPWLLCQMGVGVACTEMPVEEPTHLCVPEGHCPDVHTRASLSEGDSAQGATLFSLHCASCHGADGKGAKPGVGDLTTGDFQGSSRSAQIAATIRNGRGVGMPAFPLSDQSIANLVVFVRSISRQSPPPSAREKNYP